MYLWVFVSCIWFPASGVWRFRGNHLGFVQGCLGFVCLGVSLSGSFVRLIRRRMASSAFGGGKKGTRILAWKRIILVWHWCWGFIHCRLSHYGRMGARDSKATLTGATH